MRIRGLTAGMGWLTAVLLGCTGVSVAATYQFQVASVPEHVFRYFVKDRILPGMEAYLDDTKRSKFVVFRDRPPQLVESMGADQSAPSSVNIRLPKPEEPWGAASWEGDTGQLVVFRIRGSHSSYQRLRRVALQADGVLTRLPVHGIPPSRPRGLQVPATSELHLAHAIRSGTFAEWVERHAASYDGLSVVVGRHPNVEQSDTVYLVVRTPETGRAYKVVLGWEDMEQRGVNATGQGSHN